MLLLWGISSSVAVMTVGGGGGGVISSSVAVEFSVCHFT